MTIHEDVQYVRDELARLNAAEDKTDDDWTAIRDGLTFVKTGDEQIALLREATAAVEAGHVERGDSPSTIRDGFNTADRTPDVYDLRDLHSITDRQRPIALRDRALQAIEHAPYMNDAHREAAARLVDTDDRHGSKARYILEHGSPAYHEAFRDYLRYPAGGPTQGIAERAAMSLTGANGGVLVPFTLDPSIILTNDGATNPFREIASQVSITTDDWNGVTSAGVTAEWVAEAVEVADASPTFAQVTITVHKADAYIQGSMEVVADSAVSGEISGLIADAKNRLEATAFAVGSGSGQPYGIVTELNLVTASRVAGSSGAAGAADYVVGDVYALANALPPRYRPNSSWLGEQSTYNRTRQFATGSGPQHAFWTDLGAAIPPLLLGRPVYESSAMDSTIVSGSNDNILILGDFRHGYKIVDRMGLELVYNPLVLGSNRRPSGEVAWVAFWRVGARAVDPNAFRMLRV